MKRFAMIITIVTVCAGLSACSSMRHNFSSWTNKSDTAYLKAKATPALRVPAGLSSAKVGNSFNVPPTRSRGPVPISATPPGGVSQAQVPGKPQLKKKSSSGYFLKPIFK